MRPNLSPLVLSPLVLLAACDGGVTAAPGAGGNAPGAAGTVPAAGVGGVAGSATGGPAAGGGTAEPVHATVSISASDSLPVSAHFFGQNYWSWVPAWGDPVAAVEEQTAALGLDLLRAGGANNDAQSPAPFTLAEVDAFVAFAASVGAEPLLQVPVLANPAGGEATASDAAELVHHVNVELGLGVRYFSIGNEPDLYEEQGLKAAGYDASDFCATYAEFAAAMRAVDPSISLMGPDLSWKYQSGSNDWLTPFLQECGDHVDIVAVHRYPLAPEACTAQAAYGDASAFRQTLGHLHEIMAATGQATKPLALTEANITWDGEPATSTLPASPGTFPAALWLADSLGVALEEGLHSISYWSLSEGWTLGFFDSTTPRPAYHVLQLFSQRFGDTALRVSGAPASVSVYAGRNTAQALSTVFVVNKSASRAELSIEFVDVPGATPVALTVAPLTLQVAEVPDGEETSKLTNYSAAMTAPTAL